MVERACRSIALGTEFSICPVSHLSAPKWMSQIHVKCCVQETGSWQEVLRALCALEAVISQGSSAACGEIAVHFQVCFLALTTNCSICSLTPSR